MEDSKIDESENFALKHKPSMKSPKDITKTQPPRTSHQRRYSFYEIVQQRFTIEKLLKNVRGFLSAKSHEKKNIYNLREKTKSKIFPEVFTYAPKVSQEFLEEWLDFPTEYRWTWWNFLVLPTVWLLWTNKAIIGLEPTNKTIRERLSNSISVLGTASGLFLVIAVAALLQPPGSNGNLDPPQYLLDIFGLIMFSSFVMFLYYICIALIALYPMIQSLRDDIAFDAYEKYMKRYGGYELFYFNIGLNLLGFGMLIGCYMIYSPEYVYAMIGVFLGGYTSVVFLSKELFLALDPISAMHLGLSNSFEDRFRAELLSRYLLEKIPNTILKPNGKGVGKNQHPAVFKELRESDKYRKLFKDVDKRQQEDLLSNLREERRKASMELKSIHLNEERMNDVKSNPNEEKTDVVGEVGYQVQTQNYPHKVHEPSLNEHINCQNHKPFCMKQQQQQMHMAENEHIPQTLSDQLHHRAAEAQQRVHDQYQQPSNETHSQFHDVSRLSVLPLPELRVLFHDARYLPSVLSRKECEFAYDMLETVGCVTTGELLEYLNEMKECHVMCVGCGNGNVNVSEYRDRDKGRASCMGGLSTTLSSVKSVSDVSVIPVTGGRSDGVLTVEDVDKGEEYKEEKGGIVCSYFADYSLLHHKDCSARLSSCWTGSLKDIHIPPFSSYRIIQYLKCYLK